MNHCDRFKKWDVPNSFGGVSRACFVFIVLAFATSTVFSQCPEEPPLQNFTGAGTVVCPCFVPGEEAGAVLSAPGGDYPIEILRVGIGWGSQFGGAPQSLESAINIRAGGLPNPGSPIASISGPVMTDGFINEFDFEPLPGKVLVNSGPVTATLQFQNSNSGDIFAPSMVHDGNGCQASRNVVFAIPGGWFDACLLGVSGDWVVYVVYRPDSCVDTGMPDEMIASNVPAALLGASPNPFREDTRIGFFLATPGEANVAVYDIAGREVATLAEGSFGAGQHTLDWGGVDNRGGLLSSGVYFIRMNTGDFQSTKKIVLSR